MNFMGAAPDGTSPVDPNVNLGRSTAQSKIVAAQQGACAKSSEMRGNIGILGRACRDI
jgi:hypothetical protein